MMSLSFKVRIFVQRYIVGWKICFYALILLSADLMALSLTVFVHRLAENVASGVCGILRAVPERTFSGDSREKAAR